MTRVLADGAEAGLLDRRGERGSVLAYELAEDGMALVIDRLAGGTGFGSPIAGSLFVPR